MSNHSDHANAILRIQEEHSVQRLKNELGKAGAELFIPILRRINELLEGEDVEVLLSLAIRCFHQGQDEDAFDFISQAKPLESDNQEVLRVALFLAMAVGNVEADVICKRLLSLYPRDSWAIAMERKLTKGDVTSLSLPPLQTNLEKNLDRPQTS